ncbi:MAG: NADH-quinone oxidoreductase subunit I [Candidatus Omnitrophota bacterium]
MGAAEMIKALFVTLKNLFVKPVTLQYPTQKMPMTERFRGLVDLHTAKCIKCGQCVKICPTLCLDLATKEGADKKKDFGHFKYNMELCCFCGLCEQVCPTQAIYMGKIYEIAVYEHGKLHIDLLNAGKYDEWAHPTVK